MAVRRNPQPSNKVGTVDKLTIAFLEEMIVNASGYHDILKKHLSGEQSLDVNQTRVLMKLLDIIERSLFDIELTRPIVKTAGKSQQPAPRALDMRKVA